MPDSVASREVGPAWGAQSATRPGAPLTHSWRTHPPGVVGDDVISSTDAASVTVGQAGASGRVPAHARPHVGLAHLGPPGAPAGGATNALHCDAPSLCVSTAVRFPIKTLTGLYKSSPAREGDRGDLMLVLSGAPPSPPRSRAATSGDASGCVASCAMAAVATPAEGSRERMPAASHNPSPELPASGRRTAGTAAMPRRTRRARPRTWCGVYGPPEATSVEILLDPLACCRSTRCMGALRAGTLAW